MSEHTVTIDWGRDGWATNRFECHAPADAMCHAVWSCDCEEFYDAGIRNGVPAHRPDPDDPDRWHAGTFNAAACNLRDWFDNTDEPLRGEVTVPVRAEWQCGGYEFRPGAPVAASATVTREQRDGAIYALCDWDSDLADRGGPSDEHWADRSQDVDRVLTALGLTVADGPSGEADRG